MISNEPVPTGDDLAREALAVVRRSREMRIAHTSPRASYGLRKKVKAIICQTAQGQSLFSTCLGIRDNGDEVLTVICPSRDIARYIRNLYIAFIERDGEWEVLPKVLQFYWMGCAQPIKVPYTFARNHPEAKKSLKLQQSIPNSEITPPEPSPFELIGFNPQNREEEPFIRMWADKDHPATILSMRTEKVVAANPLVVGFCPEQYDDVVGYNVRPLFEKERGHPRHQPTDLTAFHEELKQTKTFEGNIFSWRSNGIFARYPIRAEHFTFLGGSYRLTFFDPIEIIR